jgi:hypothetical protein
MKELRDNQDKVQASIDYVTRLLTNIENGPPVADIPRKELKKLPEGKYDEILTMRRYIVRALVEKFVNLTYYGRIVRETFSFAQNCDLSHS